MPPYFKQQHKYACSLAALRSVLAQHGINVSEESLIAQVECDYGKSFTNLWNPTIAKIACRQGIDTEMYALWPLLKPDILSAAMSEFNINPDKMNIQKYENPNDKDFQPESLPLAYREMFEAIKLGCKATYGGLTANRLIELLDKGYLVQTSIKVERLYPGEKNAYHSILIYEYNGDVATYHDPARESGMTCDIKTIIKDSNGTGAFMAYE